MPSSAISKQLTFVTLYLTFAMDYVRRNYYDSTLSNVTRAYVEKTILEAVDNADFPIAYKMAYYSAVSDSSLLISRMAPRYAF